MSGVDSRIPNGTRGATSGCLWAEGSVCSSEPRRATRSRASPHPAEQPLKPSALTLIYPDQLFWEEGNFGWGPGYPLSLGLRSPCTGGPHHPLRGPLAALHLNSSLIQYLWSTYYVPGSGQGVQDPGEGQRQSLCLQGTWSPADGGQCTNGTMGVRADEHCGEEGRVREQVGRED